MGKREGKGNDGTEGIATAVPEATAEATGSSQGLLGG